MNSARNVLGGAAWLYGSQVVSMVAQIAYSSITARIIDPDGFGQYAVALSVVAFFGILAGAGMAQQWGRMDAVNAANFTSVAAYGVCAGVGWSLLLMASSSSWAALWGVPGAATLINIASLLVFLGPLSLVASGWARRTGRFRMLATITVVGNVLGMVVGGIVVGLTAEVSALLVSPSIAMLSLALVSLVPAIPLFRPRQLSFGAMRSVVQYNWRMIIVSTVSYVNGNLGKLVTSRALGAGTLGVWNRADVLSTVPFHSAQAAVLQALSPEFRHDIHNPERARALWPRVLGLSAWVFLPLAAVGAVVIPRLVPLLFGAGWEAVSEIIPALVAIAAVQAVVATLNSAVEIVGRFRWLMASAIGQLFIYAAAAVMTAIQRNFLWILCGLTLALIVQHVLQVALCSRAGYLDTRMLLGHYVGPASYAIGTFLALQLSAHLIFDSGSEAARVTGAVVAVAFLVVAACTLRFLPPYRFLRELRR